MSSNAFGLIIPGILLLLIFSIFYLIVSTFLKKSKRSAFQALSHVFLALKTIIGVTSLTAGIIMLVYGFLEYNEQKNSIQGQLMESLAEEPDQTPIIILIGGACLVVIGLTFLLLKSKESQLVNYVVVPQGVLNETTATAKVGSTEKNSFCGKCGNEIEEKNLFCSNCGAEI